jgi:hypothetical protein
LAPGNISSLPAFGGDPASGAPQLFQILFDCQT